MGAECGGRVYHEQRREGGRGELRVFGMRNDRSNFRSIDGKGSGGDERQRFQSTIRQTIYMHRRGVRGETYSPIPNRTGRLSSPRACAHPRLRPRRKPQWQSRESQYPASRPLILGSLVAPHPTHSHTQHTRFSHTTKVTVGVFTATSAPT